MVPRRFEATKRVYVSVFILPITAERRSPAGRLSLEIVPEGVNPNYSTRLVRGRLCLRTDWVQLTTRTYNTKIPMTRIREDQLIERIRRHMPGKANGTLRVGIGDDAAI